MASNTPNLNLLKKDPVADATDTFNIETMLNENWDKVDLADAENVKKEPGKGLSTEDYTTAEKTKLAGIEEGATNYTHPETHQPSIIAQDANNRFVTDTEKADWNAKETPSGAQAKADAVQTNLTTHQANFIPHIYYGATTGSANTYAVTLSPVPTGYVEGFAVAVKINVTNTGASTLNVNSLGAEALKKSNGVAFASGELIAGSIYTFRHNGANFILQGEGGGGNATASDLLSGKTATVDSGQIIGTMPNKVGSATIITPSGIEQIIPQGYYGGSANDGKVLSLALVAGDILVAYSDNQVTTESGTYAKVKEISTDTAGTVRVKFSIASFYGTYEVRGRVYINGVAQGIQRISSSSEYVEYTQDFAVSANSLIQIYTYATVGGYPVAIKNFRIYATMPYVNFTVNM
ncbi:MAG: hypothetical protein AB7V16_08870 [Vulcanibacillus sp.]